MPGRRTSVSASLRSLSSSFRSSLSSIRTRVVGSCTHDNEGDVIDHQDDMLSTAPSSSSSTIGEVPPPANCNSSPWFRLRSALQIKSMLNKRVRAKQHESISAEAPGEGHPSIEPEPEPDGNLAIVLEPSRRQPDDWFYRLEIQESRAIRQRRLQRSEQLKAIREAECTFRPAVGDYRHRRRRKAFDFLKRQRQFENIRASHLQFQKAKQEWVLRDLHKEGHQKKVADPNGVWLRSVDWNNRRLHRRIFRQIDQRIGELGQCPFEPVHDWTDKISPSEMEDFHVWKTSVDESSRSDFYRDLADVIQSLSNETRPSH